MGTTGHFRHEPRRPGDGELNRPDQRTLDALANAVRRAREATGQGGLPASSGRTREGAAATGPLAPGPTCDKSGLSRPGLNGRRPNRPRPNGRRRASRVGVPRGLALCAVTVLVLAIVITGVTLAGHTDGTARHASGPSTTPPSSSVTTTTSKAVTTTSIPPTTVTTVTTETTQPGLTTTSVPAPLAGVPRLAAIFPTDGPVGTVISVSGANFFSPNGVVLARFNGQPAPTRCPSQALCTVTVPALVFPPSVLQLTITTASGTSNAVSFRYQ